MFGPNETKQCIYFKLLFFVCLYPLHLNKNISTVNIAIIDQYGPAYTCYQIIPTFSEFVRTDTGKSSIFVIIPSKADESHESSIYWYLVM